MACLCSLIFCLPFTKAGAETFTWLAIFLWLFKRVLRYRDERLWGLFPKTGLNQALGIFIAVNALSVIFSANLGLSLRGFFGKELKFLAIYFMIVEVINSKERLKILLITIIASAVLITIDAGVQYFSGVDFLRGYKLYYHSFGASFDFASDFSAWLIIIISLCVGMISTNIIPNVKLKILLSALIITQFLCLLRTFSRGAWLGFIIATIVMIYYFAKNNFSPRIKMLCLSAAICLLTIYLFLPRSLDIKTKEAIKFKFKFIELIIDRIKSIPQTSQRSNLIRIKLWKESLRIIKDYPLIGSGLNTYSIVARNYKSFEGGGVYPHNSFLQMGAETGLLGLLAFLWILFIFFKIGLCYLKQRRDNLVLGLLAGILAFLVHAFFDTHLYSLKLVVLFWYMLGLTIAIIKLGQKEQA
jgi:putative inorganic carbon (HCO3(-)) transporter